jgi:retinol dehydrogenase-12
VSNRYNVTKLLQLYTVRELAGLISGSTKRPTVVLNISNPGFCRSNIMREASGLWLLFIECLKVVLSRTTEVGSRTLVAGAEGGLETHGQYLNDCHPDT